MRISMGSAKASHAKLAMRLAAPADVDMLFAGYERTVGPYVERVWGWDPPFQRKRFRTRYALADFRVIECDACFAGAINVERHPDEIYLALLYLLPEFRKRGIGGMLVRKLVEEGRARGMPVALTVIDGNPARAFYERFGFETVAHGNHSSRMVWTEAPRQAASPPRSRARI
jgi:GNAT superfamily N-acetyltransferase